MTLCATVTVGLLVTTRNQIKTFKIGLLCNLYETNESNSCFDCYKPSEIKTCESFRDERTGAVLLYCIAFEYLYSAPQQPWANRGALVRLAPRKETSFKK